MNASVWVLLKNSLVLFSVCLCGFGFVFFLVPFVIKFKDKVQFKLGAATLPSTVTKIDVYVFILEV